MSVADQDVLRSAERREATRAGDPEPVASLAGVALRLGAHRVLDGVDLALEPRSIYVLLGMNGAGKTTLMRTLCGRTRPDRGAVRVLGRDPRRDAAVRRAVGWVPQSIALYPSLTVRENLAAFAALGRRGRAQRVDAVLAAVRMETLAQCRVGELSGGFQRRVNLAAALVSGPSLLLLDEPTVGLDAAAKQAVVEIIASAAQGGAAILLTTHDFDVAPAGHRVGFLARGRIVVEGRPGDLLERHFGTRVRVRLQLGRPAGDALEAALRAARLTFSPADDAWCAPAEGLAQTRMDDALVAVAEAGCAIRSLSVERPGLKDLYERLSTRVA